MRRVLLVALLGGGVGLAAACESFDELDAAPPNADGGTTNDGASVIDDGGAPSVEGGSDRDTGVDARATSFTVAVERLPGLIAHYRLDDQPKSTARDSAHQNHGVVEGDVKSAPSVLPDGGDAGAAVFGGSGLVRVSANAAEPNLGQIAGAFTVGILFRLDAYYIHDQPLVAKGDTVVLRINGSAFANPNRVAALVGRKTATPSTPESHVAQTAVEPRKASLAILTVDTARGTQTLYVNGSATNATQNLTSPPNSAASELCIKSAVTAGVCYATSVPFAGVIDEIFLASEAASEEQVHELTTLSGVERL